MVYRDPFGVCALRDYLSRMTIKLLAIGKTDQLMVQNLISEYTDRLSHYINFQMDIIPDIRNTKNIPVIVQMEMEAKAVLKKIKAGDVVLLLDENGKSYSSVAFAGQLQKYMNSGAKQLVIVIGGPYGFGETLQSAVRERVSLSEMTFPHQLVRIIILEQLYRAFTILKNEPYHHQ